MLIGSFCISSLSLALISFALHPPGNMKSFSLYLFSSSAYVPQYVVVPFAFIAGQFRA